MEPSLLADSGWVQAVAGSIVSAREVPTCVVVTVLDIFVADVKLVGLITKCWIDTDAHIRPHNPVCLRMTGAARCRTVTALWKPSASPAEPLALARAATGAASVQAAFHAFASKAEKEALARHDLSGDRSYPGRGSRRDLSRGACLGVRVRWQPRHSRPAL